MIRFLFVLFLIVSALSSNAYAIRTTRYGKEEGLSNLTVRGIVCDTDGEIWFATRDGLNRFDGTSFVVYRTDPDNPGSLGCNILESICLGNDGKILIGSDTGFSIYNPRMRIFENHILPDAPVTGIKLLDNETVYLQTQARNYIFDIRKDTFLHCFRGVDVPESANFSVCALGQDHYFHMDGLMLRLGEGESVLDTLGYCPGRFSDIVKIDNVLWTICDYNALYRYEESERKFVHYGMEQGLSSDIVRTVDGFNDEIWIATAVGMDILKKDGTVIHPASFLGENEKNNFSIKTMTKDMQGGLWAGSFYGGVVRCSVDSVTCHSPLPSIVKLVANGRELLPSDKALHSCDIRFTDKVRLSSSQSNIKIYFRTVNLGELGGNRFEYILEGYEKEWHEQQGSAPAIYNNLPSGRYVFRVRSSNKEGIWCNGERVLKIHIRVGAYYYIILFTCLLVCFVILLRVYLKKKSKSCLVICSESSKIEYQFKDYPSRHFKDEDDAFIQKIVKLVEDNLGDETLNTERLASMAGMSRSTLYEKLMGVLGISSNILISEIRFTNAKLLCDAGQYDWDSISERTGFSSKYYFASTFKKRYGYHPGKAKLIIVLLLSLSPLVSAEAEVLKNHFLPVNLPESLLDNPPVKMVSDSRDVIWLYDKNNIFSYDGRYFKESFLEIEESGPLEIEGLFCDECGRTWASVDGRVMLYNASENRFVRAIPSLKADIFGVAALNEDTILICSSVGARTYSVPDGKRLNGIFPYEEMVFKCAAPTMSNIFLVSNASAELFRFSVASKTLDYVGKIEENVSNIIPVTDNSLWVETDEGALLFYKISGSSLVESDRSGTVPKLFHDEEGNTNLETRDNTIWILSSNGELKKRNIRNELLCSLPSCENVNISCITSDSEGNTWFGETSSNVVHCLTPDGIRKGFVFPGCHDPKCILTFGHKVFVGFYIGGLKILDKQSGRITSAGGPEPVNAMASDDAGGGIWLATPADLYHFDEKSNSVSFVKSIGETKVYVKKLFVNSDNVLWIASEKGLNCSDDSVVVPEEIRRATDICEYPSGTLWISTEYGLWKYSSMDGAFTKVKGPDIPDGNLYCLLNDNLGRLWISASLGLFSYDISSGQVRNYSSACGHICSQYLVGASSSLCGGRIAFCGIDGATIINPSTITPQSYTPKPFIETSSAVVEVKRGRRPFIIMGNAADYTGTEDFRALYKLEGYDKEWRESEFPLEVTYDEVGHGDYRFVLKCKNADGFVGDECACLNVNVGWSSATIAAFIAFVVLLVLTSSFFLVRKRQNKHIARNPFAVALKDATDRCMQTKDFSVDNLAAQLKMSRTVLYEKMAANMNTTPSLYVKNYRINFAKQLLATSDNTIKRISDMTGFTSQSHFTSVFRKETGLTPVEYRKIYINKR